MCSGKNDIRFLEESVHLTFNATGEATPHRGTGVRWTRQVRPSRWPREMREDGESKEVQTVHGTS